MTLTHGGRELSTLGDIMAVVAQIVDRNDPVEAAEFLAAYRVETEHADANIGYGLGYLSHEQMVAGLRLFNVKHPVFGGAPEAAKVTSEQAFEMGLGLGREMREGKR